MTRMHTGRLSAKHRNVPVLPPPQTQSVWCVRTVYHAHSKMSTSVEVCLTFKNLYVKIKTENYYTFVTFFLTI